MITEEGRRKNECTNGGTDEGMFGRRERQKDERMYGRRDRDKGKEARLDGQATVGPRAI